MALTGDLYALSPVHTPVKARTRELFSVLSDFLHEVTNAIKGDAKQTTPMVENTAILPTTATITVDFAKENIVLDKLTSTVYGPRNPPKDWADISLLVPHECIRREERAMLRSVEALQKRTSAESKRVLSWQILYFCEWFIQIFAPFVHAHHDTEEDLYFPWIQTKIEVPHKEFSKDHAELVKLLEEINDECKEVVTKQGVNCDGHVPILHAKMNAFVCQMDEHLTEEERNIPPLLRAHFTSDEEDKIVQNIAKKGGLAETRNVFPAILESMNEWTTPKYMEKFQSKIPGPILSLTKKYYLPDYKACIKPKRDAPLADTEPIFQRVGCFGLSFCFPCII